MPGANLRHIQDVVRGHEQNSWVRRILHIQLVQKCILHTVVMTAYFSGVQKHNSDLVTFKFHSQSADWPPLGAIHYRLLGADG